MDDEERMVNEAIYKSRAGEIRLLERLKSMVGRDNPSNVNRSRSTGLRGIFDIFRSKSPDSTPGNSL